MLMHPRAVRAKRASVRVIHMWKQLLRLDLLSPTGAVRNVAAVLDAQVLAMAEVDSVVARLHRHAAAERPAA